MPEIMVVPDRDRAANRGVSITTMGNEVAVMIGGQIFNANTEYPLHGHRYYIRVRTEPNQHDSVKDLDTSC